MTTRDLRQIFLSKCVGTTRWCVQIVGLMLLLAVAVPRMALAQSTTADGIRYVAADGVSSTGLSWINAYTGLASAQTSCPSSGPCVIHVAATGITLSSTFTLSRSNTTIDCEPGAEFTTTVPTGSGVPIVITGNHTRVTGCAFVYSSGSEAALTVEPPSSTSSVQDVTIDHNLFEGYPTGSGANTAMYVGDRTNNQGSAFVTDVNVTDNVFWMNAGSDINILDNAQRVNISRNRVFTGGSTSNNEIINAQTHDSGTTIQGLIIQGNIMFNGLGGDCIQVQQLTSTSGGPISDVTVASNVCTLLPPPGSSTTTTGSGYSIAGVIGASIVGNVFDASTNSVQMIPGNAPFEFVNVQNGTESGNSAVLGSQAGISGTALTLRIFTVIGNNGSTLNNAFTGNSASIAFTNGTSGSYGICWGVGSGGSSGNNVISRNTFTGNTCDLTGSTAPTVGFYMQGNGATPPDTTMQYNFVSENNFIGTNVTGDGGLCLQPGNGTVTNNVVGFNNVLNFHLLYCNNLVAQSSGLLSGNLATLTYGSNLAQQ